MFKCPASPYFFTSLRHHFPRKLSKLVYTCRAELSLEHQQQTIAPEVYTYALPPSDNELSMPLRKVRSILHVVEKGVMLFLVRIPWSLLCLYCPVSRGAPQEAI